MKISIKNLTNNAISCHTFNLTAGQSKYIEVPDADLQDLVRQLMILDGKIQYTIGSLTSVATIEQPLSLYVDQSGNDSNDGDVTRPFQTIQAALNYLRTYVIHDVVTVNIAAGTYDGFALDDHTVGYVDGKITKLELVGAITAVDSGTATALTPSSLSNAVAILTDAGKAWTVNAYADMYLEVTLSGVLTYLPIVSNTATSITVVAGSLSLNPGVYRVISLATIVAGVPVTQPGSTTGKTTIQINGNCVTDTGAAINLKLLDVRATAASSTRAVTMRGPTAAVQFESCLLSNPGLTSGLLASATEGRLALTRCNFIVSGNTLGVSAVTSGTMSASLTINGCKFASAGNAAVSAGGMSNSSVTNSYFGTCAIGLTVIAGANMLLSNTGFVGTTVGVNATNSSSFSAFFANFLNCSTAVQASENAAIGAATIHGSGNTNIITATLGGRFRLAAGATISGGNEISVDGVITTIAAMRALSPKCFPATPNVYGSYVYE